MGGMLCKCTEKKGKEEKNAKKITKIFDNRILHKIHDDRWKFTFQKFESGKNRKFLWGEGPNREMLWQNFRGNWRDAQIIGNTVEASIDKPSEFPVHRLSHLPIRPIVSLPANFSIELRPTFVLRPCNGHLNANTLFTYIYMQIRAFPGGRGERAERRHANGNGAELKGEKKAMAFVIPCNYIACRFVVVLVRYQIS